MLDFLFCIINEIRSYFVPEQVVYEVTGECKKCGKLYLKLENRSLEFPKNTMLYSLISYITNKENKKFSPMNANYGIMYGVNKKNKIEKGEESLNSIKNFVQNL